MEKKERLKQARENYLAEHPIKTVKGKFPINVQMLVTAEKFAYEYLFCVHDEDDLYEWEEAVIGAVDTERRGVFLLQIFRFLIPMKGELFRGISPKFLQRLEKSAITAWKREYDDNRVF